MSASTVRTYQEVGQQVTERLAPAKLSAFRRNAEEITVYLHRNKLNMLSADDWMTAIWALHAEDRLLWDVDPVAPKQKTQAELGAEMDRKQREKHFASIHQKSHIEAGEAGRQRHIAEAEQKELANIKSQIAREIEGHIVGHHSGGTNYTRTDSERKTLHGVAGKYNDLTTVEAAKGTLSAVRIAKNKLGR